MNLHITTPFGRRSLTPAQIDAQAIAAGCSDDTTVNKWAVFRNIAAAKAVYGVSDRSLAVLNALLTFHPETALQAGEGMDLVVFPSNEQLSLRAYGMPETTLRRHLGALVDAGLLIRRDSPNGKRYARKGQGGAITHAFGFDLTPIVARAGEFEGEARRLQAKRQALHLARERLTLLRRDAVRTMAAGAENGIAADWDGFRDRYTTIMGALGRAPDQAILNTAADDLTDLVVEVSKLLSDHLKTQNPSGNADLSERHNHNSKPDAPDIEKAAEGEEEAVGGAHPDQYERRIAYSLDSVLSACPDIADYAREPIRTWQDLGNVAELVRSVLGISPSSWRDAKEAMGGDAAAVTVAAILQRAEHIRSPGGYLRTLVERRRAGQFSLDPVLKALLRARSRHLALVIRRPHDIDESGAVLDLTASRSGLRALARSQRGRSE